MARLKTEKQEDRMALLLAMLVPLQQTFLHLKIFLPVRLKTGMASLKFDTDATETIAASEATRMITASER